MITESSLFSIREWMRFCIILYCVEPILIYCLKQFFKHRILLCNILDLPDKLTPLSISLLLYFCQFRKVIRS